MTKCPNCNAELSAADLSSGKCSQCSASFEYPVQTTNREAGQTKSDPAQTHQSTVRGVHLGPKNSGDAETDGETKTDGETGSDGETGTDPDQPTGDSNKSPNETVVDATIEIGADLAAEINNALPTENPDKAEDPKKPSVRLGSSSSDLTAADGGTFPTVQDIGMETTEFGAGIDPGTGQTITSQPTVTEEDSKSTAFPKVSSGNAGKAKTVKVESGKDRDASESDSHHFPTMEVEQKKTRFNETVQLDTSGFPIESAPDADSRVKGSDSHLNPTVDSDIAEMLHPTWEGAIDGLSHPSVTLESDVDSSGVSSAVPSASSEDNSLNIQPRVLVSDPQVESEKVADYGVLEILGKGGMGIVYSARQASLDRDVAVKMLLPDGAKNPRSRNAFLAEAAVTGDLEHPNIVPIYDLGRADDGAFFYAMKHVRGTPWDKTIAKTSLTENLEHLLRVCDAVAFSHSKGIIHRDLKPENTMIGDYGEVMVMDWGLATPTDHRPIAGIELAQTMAGTPSYMAPEMAHGPFESITTRSDIYLLGAILFEIVTGKPPHAGEDSRSCMISAARNVIRETKVQSELVDIALRAMASKQDDRYQTVQEFQHAIREYQSHSESIALSALAAESLDRADESGSYDDFNGAVFGFQQAIDLWSENTTASTGLLDAKFEYAKVASQRGDYDLGAGLLDLSLAEHETLHQQIVLLRDDRKRREQRSRLYRQVGLGLAGLLFLVISGAAIWINSARNEAVNQRELADIAKLDAEQKREAAVQAKASEEQQRLIAEQKRKDAELAREQEKEQRELAESAKEAERMQRVAAEKAQQEAVAAKLAEEKQKEVAEQQKLVAQQQRQVAEQQRIVADQKRQEAIDARQAEAYEAYVARIAAAASRIDENAYLGALELLRDCIPAEGETDYRNWEWGRMVYLCQQASEVLDVGFPLETIAKSNSNDQKLGLIATAGDSGTIQVWAPASGFKKEFQAPVAKINSLAFSPSNRKLAIGSEVAGQFVLVLDLATGQFENLTENAGADAHSRPVLGVAYSADGKRILSASRSGKIKVWDSRSNRVLATLHRHRSAVQHAQFYSSGSSERAGSDRQTKMISVGHDGNAIVWEDPTGIWGSNQAIEVRGIFREQSGPIFASAVSPDGDRIATAGLNGEILIWDDNDLETTDMARAVRSSQDAASDSSTRQLIGHTAAVRSLSFSDNGRMLVSAGHDNTVRIWDAETGKTVKVLRGHGRWVRGCVAAGDGQSIASAGYDGSARVWNVAGYEELRVLRGRVLDGHQDGIMAAQFSGDSRKVVTASRDRTIKTWDVKSGNELLQFREGHAFLASDAISFGDGSFLATAAGDETVRLWDTEHGAEIRKLDETGRSAAISVSRDGKWVLTGGPVAKEKWPSGSTNQKENKRKSYWSARLWNTATGELIHQLIGHQAMVSTVAISPGGKYLYTGDVNGGGMLWDPSTGDLVKKLPWHQSKIIRAGFTPNEKQLITASLERGIAVWDIASGRVDRNKVILHPTGLVSVDIDQRSETLVSSDDENKVRIWDIASRTVVQQFEMSSGDESQRADKVSISPDGKQVIAVNRKTGIARLFDSATGNEITFRQPGKRKGGLLEPSGGSRTNAVVFAGDRSRIVSVGGDQIRLWGTDPDQPQYRRLQMNFSPHGGVASANFSTDSKEIVSGSWDGTANIWNAATGAVRTKLVGRHAGPVHCAVFSPDPESKMIATASADRTVVLWNSQTGKFIKRLVGHKDAINWVSFSPDGRHLLSASNDSSAIVWDLGSGKPMRTIDHDSEVIKAIYSPDGKRIATSTVDNLAFIWSASKVNQSGAQPIMQLAGHTAPVTSIAFSPDGKRAITGSEDFTAKVWDVTNRGPKELMTLTGHLRTVTSVAFSPDRLSLLTGSQDGTAIVWMADDWKQSEIQQTPLAASEPTPVQLTSSTAH